jgi:hypothetical protein
MKLTEKDVKKLHVYIVTLSCGCCTHRIAIKKPGDIDAVVLGTTPDAFGEVHDDLCDAEYVGRVKSLSEREVEYFMNRANRLR